MPRNRKAKTEDRAASEGLRPSAVQRAGDAMNLPGQLLPGFSHLELMGNRQAIVEGVKGVLAYCEGSVRLNLGSLVVAFEGCDLCIRSYQGEQVILSGTILGMQFTN